MIRTIVTLLLLLFSALLSADVFKWRDPEGNIHYSHLPHYDHQSEKLNIDECRSADCIEEMEERAKQSEQELAQIKTWLKERRETAPIPRKNSQTIRRSIRINSY